MSRELIYGIAAVICAALLAFTSTPAVRVLAFRIGAIDRPDIENERRMHKEPVPRIGGLAIFFAFAVTILAFCQITPTIITLLIGGFLLVILGILDDKFRLNAIAKLLVQIAVALFAVSQGITIDFFNFFGKYISFGDWSILITVLWIVGLTNAVNLIDGLDGLACGVSAICSISLFCVTLLMSDPASAILTAILAGSCIGFLPFNSNPAKIFMGDAGALFLGYTLSVLSIVGVFKTHTVLSFIIPFSIFGLPLFDTIFAFFRRILHGKNPFAADRGHIHHKLIDMGFGHKQTVMILYAISGILGISAVMLTDPSIYRALIIIVAAAILFIATYLILLNEKAREQSGIYTSKDKNNDNTDS